MTLGKRIALLEAVHPMQANSGEAQAKLHELLEDTWSKIQTDRIDNAWVEKRSPVEILATGLFGPWPLCEATRHRLSKLASNDGPAGKLATQILEVH